MKSLIVAALLLALAHPLFSRKANRSVEQLLIQMEHDWSEADVRRDAAALNRILADDWIGIDFQGTTMTKAEVLKEVGLHSDETRTESTVLGEMKVRIYGNTALVSGTETEKSRYRGQDSSGEYIWMDVFVFRNGRWQAVSSQSTKLSN